MQRFRVDAALIGDVLEQRHAGRSALWLWRQTIIALVHRIVSGVQQDPLRAAARVWGSVWLATGTLALSLSLPYVWMHFLWHYAAMLDMSWYPRSLGWMARSSPHIVWQLFILLHPWAWSYMAVWCAVLGALTWSLVRFKPRQRDLILTLLVLSQIGPCLPTLTRSFIDWSHEPANPVGILNLVWYAVFVFAAIPLSIATGGRWWHTSHPVTAQSER
jgi:hypothetical protein